MESVQLQVKSFKKMEDPVDRGAGNIKYVCYALANSIPLELENWMLTNPREQKMTTNVANKIQESLKENSNFHDLNRGILMSVDKVEYDNKEGVVTIAMNDPEIHGNIDGGHTLRAILNAQRDETLRDDRFVFFEFYTGLESPVELAAARNTSIQVDLKSIEELSNSFGVIKEVIKNQSFADRIAYKMNEQIEGKVTIDIREIITLLNMFNQQLYPLRNAEGILNESQPIQSYTGKEASLKKFLNLGKDRREEIIINMEPIVDDIFRLWDKIERTFAEEAGKAGKRYGAKKYSKYDDNKAVGKALFSEAELKHIVPKGILYPLVGAFRSLVIINPSTNKYEWKKNPITAWEDLGAKLSAIVLDEKADNPDVLGKNNNLWSNLFKEVLIYGYSIGY